MQLIHKTKTPGIDTRRGFTLIEMSIVILILSLTAISFLPMVKQYFDTKKVIETEQNIVLIKRAMGNYFANVGEYPAPASPTAARGTPAYGQIDTSDVSTVLPGNASSSGIIRQDSLRNDAFGNPFVIRVGTLPFRALGLNEKNSLDGYGNKFTYAVTEVLTDRNTFSAMDGGVEIIDNAASTIISPAASAHFAIISHGKNENGAFNVNGIQITCGAAAIVESDNCNMSANAVYRYAEQSSANNNNFFDDKIVFNLGEDVPLWQLSNNPGALNSLELKTDNLGINFIDVALNTASGISPAVIQELHPSGSIRAEGAIQLEELCDPTHNPDSAYNGCFPITKLAGNSPALRCPKPAGPWGGADPGTAIYMLGIDNGVAQCGNEINKRCPSGQYLSAIGAGGALTCVGPPPPQCPPKVVTLCLGTPAQTDVSLTFGDSNDRIWSDHPSLLGTIVGDSFKQRFHCRPGSLEWRAYSSRPWWRDGQCVCTPSVNTTPIACPAGFLPGMTTETTTVTCGVGGTTTTTIDFSACTCEPRANDQRGRNCPSPLTRNPVPPAGDPDILEERPWTCNMISGVGSWGLWSQIHNHCICQPEVVTTTGSCPTGFGGNPLTDFITYENTLSCPSATWSGPIEVGRNCPCAGGTFPMSDLSCPPGETGAIERERTLSCPSGTWGVPVLTNNCTAVIVNYKWRAVTSNLGPGSITTNPVNGSCTAADNANTFGAGENVSCHDPDYVSGHHASRRFMCQCLEVPTI